MVGRYRICTLYVYLLLFRCACCLHNTGAGAFGTRPAVVESIMGEHMCIKYARVCISCLGLMNPLSRSGQGAVLDMDPAVGWTMGVSSIPAEGHIGYG